MKSRKYREGRMIFELSIEESEIVVDKWVDTVANRLDRTGFN